MPYYAAYSRIYEPLRDDRTRLRVCLIVFDRELELRGAVAELYAPRIELFDRHARAIQVVLSEVRLRPRQRRSKADFYDGGALRESVRRRC
jgi:hypothetical protein